MSFINNPIISLVGNISAGKSTFLKYLEENPSIFNHNAVIVYEPVDLWTKPIDNGGDSMLSLFYKDNVRYGFVFQMYTLQTRLEHLINVAKENPGKLLICERCPISDYKIFAQMLYEQKVINDHEMMVYKKWFDMVYNIINPNICGIAYLKVPISTCASRIIKRDRKGEGNITMDYLHALHDVHERWLGKDTIGQDTSHGKNTPIYEIELDENENIKVDNFVSFVNQVNQVNQG